MRVIAGRKVTFDDEGFFDDFEDWSEEIFEALAHESGISLITDQHRQVVRVLREFYAYNGRAPLNNEIRKGTSVAPPSIFTVTASGLTGNSVIHYRGYAVNAYGTSVARCAIHCQ